MQPMYHWKQWVQTYDMRIRSLSWYIEDLECNNGFPDRPREETPNLGIKLRRRYVQGIFVMLIEIIILVASWADKSMFRPHLNLMGKPSVRTTKDSKCKVFCSFATDTEGNLYTCPSLSIGLTSGCSVCTRIGAECIISTWAYHALARTNACLSKIRRRFWMKSPDTDLRGDSWSDGRRRAWRSDYRNS